MDNDLVRAVRLHVIRTAMNTTAVPSASETAASLRISDEQAVEAYRQLGEAHVYVLEPRDATRLRMANPFSAVPTAFEVDASGKSYYGNCVWDGLGIVSLMGGTGQLKTRCPDCGEALTPGRLRRRVGQRSRSRALQRPGRALVGRHYLYVKHDASLPVGRARRAERKAFWFLHDGQPGLASR